MTADIDGSINAIFMTGDLVSILKVIQMVKPRDRL